MFQLSSVQSLSRVRLFATHGLQHTRLPCHSLSISQLAQIHVHWVYDVIQPAYPLLSPSPPPLNLSQNQGLFQWVSSSHQVAKVLELQYHSWWIFRVDLLAVQGTQESSPAPQFKRISSSALNLLYGPTLTFVQDYQKNRSFDYIEICRQSNISAF